MIKENFFEIFYTYLEEQCGTGVVAEQLDKDETYQKALEEEHAFYEMYKNLDLTDEQRAIVDQWGIPSRRQMLPIPWPFSAWECKAVFP